ncbi:MAG: DUF3788 domain-containing protein [Thermoguttaceae bacterium]
MSDTSQRITESGTPPTQKQLESWLGKKAFGFWQQVEQMIAERYPGVFVPEWLYGGKKHGWSVRYKRSKSFCTMIPEKGRCLLVIVFGREQRAKVDAIRTHLSPQVRKAYDEATTYHDGKWLLLNINNKTTLADAVTLLAVKRKPKA